MRADVIIVDNFYGDLEGVRKYALTLNYYYPYEPDASVAAGEMAPTWMASEFKSSDECPFKSSPELIATLEYFTGERINMDHWNAGFPTTDEGKPAPGLKNYPERGCVWNCAFHCKPENGQQLGDGVHNHVTDVWNGVGIDGWAGLIYLNDDAPLGGGLKLWRNIDPDRNFDWMTPRSHWELVDDIGNVPNRLVLARGNLPHSGASGWGDSLSTGRLYQTFFFKTIRPRLRDRVWITL